MTAKHKGIYILVTKGPQYRVAGSSEIERCSLGIWDDKTNNWLLNWKFVHETFTNAPFSDKEKAIEFAKSWVDWLRLQDNDHLEDGIQFISNWKNLQYENSDKASTSS